MLTDLLYRLRALLRRGSVEGELGDELEFHLAHEADKLVRSGLSREEAYRRARVALGGQEQVKEECRDAWGIRWVADAARDLRYAVRMLRQAPAFAAVAVLSLALGIGANTAIFSLAKEVLLKSMAVPRSEQLRMLEWSRGPKAHPGTAWGSFRPGQNGEMVGNPFPYALYVEMRRHNEVMEDLVAFKDVYKLTATIDGQAEAIDGMLVSGNFYQTLGARIIAGRGITAEDDSPAASSVAVISDGYWARRFGRSASTLGRTIQLNRLPVTIVGVNAPEFNGPKAGGTPEIFIPISAQPQVIPNQRGGSLLANRGYWWLMILGRLKPGISDRAAQAALDISFRNAFHATLPDKKESDLPRLLLSAGSRGLDLQSGEFKEPIYLLLGLAGLVLLIACANLANLLLARSAARQREMSVRLAMGAGRLRVMRQGLTEAMLLALSGGTAGLLLGYWGRNVIPNLAEQGWRRSTIHAEFDWRVFTFAFGITIITGLLFGLTPAWRSTHTDVSDGLKETGRMSTGRPRALLGKALVVFQVSLSMLLLVVAGLFLRTLANLKTTVTGINPERIVLFDLDPPRARYPAQQRIALYQRLEEKMMALGGVQAATVSSEPLLAESMDNGCVRPTGRPPGSQDHDNVWTNDVGARFFETFGIAIVRGRGFTAHDNQHAPKVAVINRELAKRFFPNADPIGKAVSSCEGGASGAPIEIVGVSADAKYSSLREDPPPTLYVPYLQDEDLGSMTFELKTAANLESVMAEVREAVRSLDKDLPLLEVRTQTQQIDATVSKERLFATLTSGFGLLALILASIGIYGIMAYTVARRTNEIGIRLALGAQTREVLAMVLGETSILAVIGVAAGLGASLALTRLVASMLYGLKPTDPLTLLGAAGLLAGIAIAAGLAPARRAASVDPMHALRHE